MGSEVPGPVRVGLLGCGVVGSAVARGLITMRQELSQRVGADLVLSGIAVLDPGQVTDPVIDRALLTTDAQGVIDSSDIVIELIGGVEPARQFIGAALKRGASVVSANKALLAQHGPELYEAADAAGVDLLFEAAVGGAIPIIRPLRISLAGDRVRRVLGIVNGTTNYVLDEMTRTGAAFDDVVRRAQQLGYAEADPSADVEGYDAASKAAILASIAFHTRVHLDDVYRVGITKITQEDVDWARRTGHVIKLLAVAERLGEGDEQAITVRVRPTLVPLGHQLASVGGAYNAIYVQTELAGDLMFYGAGAGGTPTSSAVIGDVVAAARHRLEHAHGPTESTYARLPIADPANVMDRFQVRLRVADRPGVLAQVAGVFAEFGLSIELMQQVGEAPDSAQVVIVTHPGPMASFDAAVARLDGLPAVRGVVSQLRVEGA